MRHFENHLAVRLGALVLLHAMTMSATSSGAAPSHPLAASDLPAPEPGGSTAASDERLAQTPPMDRQLLLSFALPAELSGRVQRMLQEATTMADRGALFAAREQFLRVMRTICQSLDSQLGQAVHTQALARGLRALEEADDFALTGATAEADLNLEGYIEVHRTPVLKGQPLGGLTALLAMQQYYKYAFLQLAIAGNDEPLASEALYCLGRVEAVLSAKKGTVQGGGPRALALYHAAWTAHHGNTRAANELAVMLARRGQFTQAEQLLNQAVQAAPDPTLMQNLAVVYQQMGQGAVAQHWSQQAAIWRERPEGTVGAGRQGAIQWVDSATFARLSADPIQPALSAELRPPFAPAAAPQPLAPATPRTAERVGVGFWSY